VVLPDISVFYCGYDGNSRQAIQLRVELRHPLFMAQMRVLPCPFFSLLVSSDRHACTVELTRFLWTSSNRLSDSVNLLPPCSPDPAAADEDDPACVLVSVSLSFCEISASTLARSAEVEDFFFFFLAVSAVPWAY